MKNTFFLLLALFPFWLNAQSNIQQSVSVNSTGTAPDASAQLDVSSTDKGMLVPRMTTAQRTAIASPATGLLVFDTNTGGFWFYNGTVWTSLSSDGTLSLISDLDADTKVQVEESADEDIIRFDTRGAERMVIDSTGKVGIGTSTPTEKLTVAGSIKTDSFVLPTAAANGYFLRSDVSGNATWQPLVEPSQFPTPAPMLSGGLAIGSFPNSVAVQGNYAYVVDQGSNDLKIINVSYPVSPALSGSMIIGESASSVAVQGNYAYVVDQGSNDLKIINVSNPASPALSGSMIIGESPSSVAVQGNYVYVVDQGSNDLKIISVSNPTSPALSGSMIIGESASSVAVQGNYAYVVDQGSNDLKIINVSNPASPALSGSIVIGETPSSVAVQGIYTYVVDQGSDDLKVIQLADLQPIGIGLNGQVIPIDITLDIIADADGNTKIQVEESADENKIRFDISGTERIIIDNNGKVGIGTSSPAAELHVNGSIIAKGIADADNNTKIQVEESPNENIIRFDLSGNEKMKLMNNASGHARLDLTAVSGNTLVGSQAGNALTTGVNNTALGFEALKANAGGSWNTGLGYRALTANTSGYDNTAIGMEALNANTGGFRNTANGASALSSNTTGYDNTAYGVSALLSNTIGFYNTANGALALYSNTIGTNNTANGVSALNSNTTGSYNTAYGRLALHSNTTGSNNTALGYQAGRNATGSGNVFLGNNAGHNETGSNLLYIDNSSTATPLIWGNFAAGNRRVGINRVATSNSLEVEGNASKSSPGDWLGNSDARLKRNIQPLDSRATLQKLLALQGVAYEWDDDKTGTSRPEGVQYGFTAQNIQSVFPELVSEDAQGYLQTAYGTYDAMYVEALRALAMENEAIKAENERLKNELAALRQAQQETVDRLQVIEAKLSGETANR